MAEDMTSKPKAFVIMPFGDGFDEIYHLFIASALIEAGYEVLRADDIRSHQNILKDILTGIVSSNLIVADLSGANPNVYYELGLAHGFCRPTILLTQHIDELPFDMRSYRVIPYSTHFAEISKAREQLVNLARDAITAAVPFGSPVTDFLSSETIAQALQAVSSASERVRITDGEPGLLDHLVDLEEGFQKLVEIVTKVSTEMNSISVATTEVTERLQTLAATGSPARTRRVVVIAFAQRLSDYAQFLSHQNDCYADVLTVTRTSLEFLIRAQNPSTKEEKEQLQAFLAQLDYLESGTQQARATIAHLAETIRSTPRIERTFNRAADNTVHQLERYAQNLDQTTAMIVRIRELAQSRLNETSS